MTNNITISNNTVPLNYSQVSAPAHTPTSQYTISTISTGPGIFASNGSLQQSALTVMDTNGDAIITFHKDGRIETEGGSIQAKDLTAVIKLMKRMMTDIASDEELSARFPYIKDAAHEWVMDELRK
jgi:hypothetical protein